MTDESKDIVKSIVNKDLNNAKEKIQNELYRRSGNAIEQLKPEVMGKAFGDSSDEEVDETKE